MFDQPPVAKGEMCSCVFAALHQPQGVDLLFSVSYSADKDEQMQKLRALEHLLVGQNFAFPFF